MAAQVGDDAFGALLVNTLNSLGIGTGGIRKDPDVFTTLAFVTLSADGERRFSFSRKPGADTMLRKDEIDFGQIDAASLFHFGTLSMTDEPAKTATEAAVAHAREKGITVSFDPNYRPSLWRNAGDAKNAMLYGMEHADIIKISDDEVEFFCGRKPEEGAEFLFESFPGCRLLLVSCGKDGCFYRNRNAYGFVPALSVQAVDCTGAGDIFFGSFICRFLKSGKQPDELQKAELEEMLSFASRAAGLSVQRFGGIPSIPELSEVQ